MGALEASVPPVLRVHATTVALSPSAAVLLRGASGAGKSDLALRFLSAQSHASGTGSHRYLVADDQTCLTLTDGNLMASAPLGFAGLIEVRGVGLVTVPSLASAEVRLAIDLVPAVSVERYPLELETVIWLGKRVPLRRISPFEASAPLKLVMWLNGVITEGPS